MKITKAKLKDIIKEELSAFSEEDNTTPIEVVAAAMALTNFFEGKPGDLSAKADLYAAAEEEGADRS